METFLDLEGHSTQSPTYSFCLFKGNQVKSQNQWILLENAGRKDYDFERFCNEELPQITCNRSLQEKENTFMNQISNTIDTLKPHLVKKKKIKGKIHPIASWEIRKVIASRKAKRERKIKSAKQAIDSWAGISSLLSTCKKENLSIQSNWDVSTTSIDNHIQKLQKKGISQGDTISSHFEHRECT